MRNYNDESLQEMLEILIDAGEFEDLDQITNDLDLFTNSCCIFLLVDDDSSIVTINKAVVNNDDNLLNVVEYYASVNGLIEDEAALSKRFDHEIMPSILEQYGKKGIAFDDTTLICEEFNNWADSLCQDGEIHPIQCDKYCYVGEYDE